MRHAPQRSRQLAEQVEKKHPVDSAAATAHRCKTGHMSTDLIGSVLEAQSRNSQLSGDDLTYAAKALFHLLRTTNFCAVASDPTGERILGAALVLYPSIRVANRSDRFDGAGVLLVAGYLSGDARVSTRARTVRALGAVNVHAATLTREMDHAEACDRVWHIGREHSLSAVFSA